MKFSVPVQTSVSAQVPAPSGGGRRLWLEARRTGRAYSLISPFYILFVIFFLYPLLFSFYLSFTKWRGLGPIQFVGLANYVILLKDKLFWQSIENSAILFVMHVPLMILLALLLAVLLNSPRVRGFRFFRLLIVMPYVSNIVAASITFRVLLDQNHGLVNSFLGRLGIPPVPWLESVWGGRVSLCLLILWAWLGYYMVILLAGLQTLPRELAEAARIDGANSAQAFRYITIPLMRPALAFCLVLATINTFSLFTEIVMLTGGGPINATLTPVLYVYRYAFLDFQLGYGSAVSYVFFTVVLMLAILQVRYFRRKEI